MNSQVIKYVAGGGKTTFSINYLKENKNGLYLAFTNSVITEVKNKGFLSKTIDSLFVSFLIPKLCSLIPIISSCSKITFVDVDKLPSYLKNVSQIRIDEDGKIYNQKKIQNIDVNEKNDLLHLKGSFPNSKAIKYIFDKNKLRLTHELRAGLCEYMIKNYPDRILELLSDRFNYIIIDEAQDLNGYREKFAELIHLSSIKTIILGDDNQNINGGGEWFKDLEADKIEYNSYRCPETNCEWIRNNLKIKIYGNSNLSSFNIIGYSELEKYNDGEKFLLYCSKTKQNKMIIENWNGPKDTIKSAKGSTIDKDIVIIGKKLNCQNLYTAITRTTKNVCSTIIFK